MMKKIQGFTIVELSFAITFISILILSIGYLTIHITTIYQKGLAMKAVNSVGKELIDDFSRTISASPARTVESLCSKYQDEEYQKCLNDNARKFSFQQRYKTINIKGNLSNLPVGGVFCTGRYSYIWNTAYAINTEDYQPVPPNGYLAEFKINGGEGTKNFRLLKVSDFRRELCLEHLDPNKYAYDDDSTYDLLNAPQVHEELLENSENNLAIYDFTIFAPTVHGLTSSGFYSGTFILATLRGGININSTGEFCSDPPDGLKTDFAYCAINKFNFSMRAVGEKLSHE